jgi:hypothetical protein
MPGIDALEARKGKGERFSSTTSQGSKCWFQLSKTDFGIVISRNGQ